MTPEFYCAICHKNYDTVEKRAECESKCIAERRKAEEAKKRNEYETQRKIKEKTIHNALHEVDEMIKQHVGEYGAITIGNEYPYLKYIFSHNSLWF